MHSKIFLINLARSSQRLACCNAEFSKAGLNFDRVEAIDGNALTNQQVDDVYQWTQSDYYKQLSKDEVACYLSHRMVWQRIIDENLDFAIVVEDDIGISRNTAKVIQLVSDIRQDWDYIKLAEFPEKRDVVHHSPLCSDEDSYDLVTYQKVPNRTCAQAISKTGAQKLLQHSLKIGRPVDIDLQYWWEKELKVFGIKPYPIRVNIGQPSTIERFDDSNKLKKRSLTRQIIGKYRFIKQNKHSLEKRLQELEND